jgi:succinoglycan biosynthesis protein ExoM
MNPPEASDPNSAINEDLTIPPLGQQIPHISVCICTYKRPVLLKRLLDELKRQETGGLFSYSIVVADNDEQESAKFAIEAFRSTSEISLKYCIEPRQGIALARNKVVGNATGDYLALIDDDEFPSSTWLLTLFKTCREYKVDGVLGPVKRHFDEIPPKWLLKSRFFDRKINPTGMAVEGPESRTGNVLLKREVLAHDEFPFRPEFTSGEDWDFFRRKTAEGRVFIWSAEGDVFEVVPPSRWKRTYILKRALLNGSMRLLIPSFGARDIAKSIVAVPVYVLALPFTLLLGQHRFMSLLERICSHLGRLLALAGIYDAKGKYLTD